jgi:hypothetical protein
MTGYREEWDANQYTATMWLVKTGNESCFHDHVVNVKVIKNGVVTRWSQEVVGKSTSRTLCLDPFSVITGAGIAQSV